MIEMSNAISRGQKTDLTKQFPSVNNIVVGLGWETSKEGLEIDAAAFMLQANGKCRSDEDFIFYSNPTSRGNCVIHTTEVGRTADKARININLADIPADVEKVAFTLTIYEGQTRGHNFGQLSSAFLKISTQSNEELISFNMGKDFTNETAIVVAELYRHQGQWKVNPIAMGYQGGLAALCGGFGIVVDDTTPPTPPKVEVKTEVKPIETASKINFHKIELTKKGQKINLEKKAGNQLGEILVNLNWNQKPQESKGSKGLLNSLFGGSASKGIDLDLGCFVELKNGEKHVIQALGKNLGSLSRSPYVSLDGDDRTGAVTTGENLRINGNFVSEIKRILIFAFIYEGVTNWAQADGIVTIKQPGGPDIVVKLDEHTNNKATCAVALIENERNETFSIERSVQYFSGHKDMDQAYGWGFRWVAGSKD